MDISLDPQQPVLILRFIQGDGQSAGKSTTQRITVKKLKPDTNVPLLASTIMQRSGTIPASQLPTVELLLYQLQARQYGNLVRNPSFDDSMAPQGLSAAQQDAQRMLQQDRTGGDARLEDLQEYISYLYDDKASVKIQGANCIAQLFNNLDNYDALLSQDTLVPTLARVLRDDGKLSTELCLALMRVLFCLSCFSQLHALLVDNMVGSLTFDILDLEFKRTQRRQQEEGCTIRQLDDILQHAEATGGRLTPQQQTYASWVVQQDRLLYLAFYLLLNLAEDAAVEKKMRKKNLLNYLLTCMDRYNTELLTVLVTFLKKLTVHDDCKLAIATPAIVLRLNQLMHSTDEALMLAVLKLIYNLSFDPVVRSEMVKLGMIPRMVDLLARDQWAELVLGVLYHTSTEPQHRTAFAASGCVPKLFDMLVRARRLADVPQLVALLLNLSSDAGTIQEVHKARLLPSVIGRGIASRDPLMLKVLHHIASHSEPAIKTCFKEHYERLVILLEQAINTDTDVFVEVLSILANLHFAEYDFPSLLQRHNLLGVLLTIFQQCAEGFMDEDVLLEVAGLVGSICHHPGTAQLLVDSGLANQLVQLVLDKRSDTFFHPVLAFTCHQMLLFDATRAVLVAEPGVVTFLVDCWATAEPDVQEAMEAALDALIAADPAQWGARIMALKFERYNREWLAAVQGGAPAAVSRVVVPGSPSREDGEERLMTFMDFKHQTHVRG